MWGGVGGEGGRKGCTEGRTESQAGSMSKRNTGLAERNQKKYKESSTLQHGNQEKMIWGAHDTPYLWFLGLSACWKEKIMVLKKLEK